MNNEELAGALLGVQKLCLAQATHIRVLNIIQDALILTLGTNFPPLISELSGHISGLTNVNLAEVNDDSIELFQILIGDTQRNLRKLENN